MIPLTSETDCWVLLDSMSWCCDYILKKDFSWRLQSKAPNPARANYFYIINHQEQMALHFAPRFWDWDAIMKGIMSTGFRLWEYFWKISKFKFDWLSVAIRCIKWLKYIKIVYNTKTKIGFFTSGHLVKQPSAMHLVAQNLRFIWSYCFKFKNH